MEGLIHERVFAFVIRGLQVHKYLPKSVEFRIVIDQFLRSLTSVGANNTEEDGVSSRKNFIHFYSVVCKELGETYYGFRVIVKLYPTIKPQIGEFVKEHEELILIVSLIIKNSIKSS